MNKKNRSLSVLIYDDDENFRKLLRTMLGQSLKMGFTIREAQNDEEMEAELAQHRPDVIILDLELEGKSGLDWLRDIHDQDIAPVVFITGSGSEQIAVEVMKAGAFDYIPKAYITFDLLNRALANARERWDLQKEKERLQEELAHMAMYDALTEVLSRRALLEQLEFETQRTRRYKRNLSLLMLDIDRFKRVNDTHGHLTGDSVLRAIAQTLQNQTRGSDFVGRYGGEEFLVILPETKLDQALILADKLLTQVAKLEMPINGQVLKGITVSIGAASFENDDSVDAFISRSDEWLYAAKENGRNQVQPQSSDKQ